MGAANNDTAMADGRWRLVDKMNLKSLVVRYRLSHTLQDIGKGIGRILSNMGARVFDLIPFIAIGMAADYYNPDNPQFTVQGLKVCHSRYLHLNRPNQFS